MPERGFPPEQGSPFSEPLEKKLSVASDDIFSLERSPHFIVRKMGEENGIFEVMMDYPELFDEETDEVNWDVFLDLCKTGEKVLTTLRDKYKVALPDFAYVRGKDDAGKDTVFMVIERIEGEDLDNVSVPKAEREQFHQACDMHYSRLLRYMREVYQQGGWFPADIFANRQSLYGHKEGETEKKIYLVDIEPFLRHYDHGDYNGDFWKEFEDFAEEVVEMEKRTGVLSITRMYFDILLEDIETDPHLYAVAESIRTTLELDAQDENEWLDSDSEEI